MLALSLLVGEGAGTGASSATGAATVRAPNVVGRLTGSPYANVTPPCPPDEPCDPPARPARLIFSRSGHVAGATFVGAGGRFRLHLAHGRYRISVAPRPARGRLTPSTIRVPHRGVVHLQLAIR